MMQQHTNKMARCVIAGYVCNMDARSPCVWLKPEQWKCRHNSTEACYTILPVKFNLSAVHEWQITMHSIYFMQNARLTCSGLGFGGVADII